MGWVIFSAYKQWILLSAKTQLPLSIIHIISFYICLVHFSSVLGLVVFLVGRNISVCPVVV